MPEDPEEPEDDASVLTPEELELEDEREDAVRKIGENRYVIRPNEDDHDDELDPAEPSSGPLADAGGVRSPSSGSTTSDEDTGKPRSPSPDSASPRRDADAHGASSPDSPARQDAGSRDAASESSLADERSSSSLGSASPRQDADARENAGDASAPNVGVEARALALEHTAGQYGIDAVVDTGDGVAERRLVADDQIAVFEQFLRWYARQVDPDAAPAATISALLAEADLSE